MRDFTVQVGTPTKATSEESAVRDEADRPVLRGAKAAGCDFLVTGDRDLLEADIRSPSVLTPAEYVSRGTRQISRVSRRGPQSAVFSPDRRRRTAAAVG